MDKWWQFNGADYWTDFAVRNKIPLMITGFFSPTVDPIPAFTSEGDTSNYIESRIRKLMPYVKKLHDNGVPVEVTFANEPVFEFQGQMYWMGIFKSRDYAPYRFYGDKWISTAYARFARISINEFGLVPGKDFKVIGIVEPGIELPGAFTNFVVDTVIRTKKEIFAQVGKEMTIARWEDIPFDVATEFHFGRAVPTDVNPRNVTVPLDKVDRKIIAQNLRDIATRTNSSIVVTEQDALEDDKRKIGDAYATVILAAYDSGVVREIIYFRPFSYPPPDDPWRNDLFEPNYGKGIVYYLTLKGLFDAANLK